MFFVFGVSSKEESIDFTQTKVCSNCGAYGRFEVYLTYSYFSLFFIPLIKWKRKYFVRTTCCDSLYTIDEDLGKDIERGDVSKIDGTHLRPIRVNTNHKRTCLNCNFSTEEQNFVYCPKCGNKL